MIRLEEDYHGFKCPHCDRTLSVESWGTEYGDPQVGEHTVTCPFCCKNFTIEVYVSVVVTSHA